MTQDPANIRGEALPQPKKSSDPVRLTNVNFAGISAQSAAAGEMAKVYTRMGITSQDPLFFRMINNLAAGIEGFAAASGHKVNLRSASYVLLVIRPDASADLWIDSTDISMTTLLRRAGPIAAGAAIFEHDIVQVKELWFPDANIGPSDRIVCIIREGWRFAFFMDMNVSGVLDITGAQATLGSLYCQMKYADLYEALENRPLYDQVIASGWFPFVELIKGDFQTLCLRVEEGRSVEAAQSVLLQVFDDERVDGMFRRWMEMPHLKEREIILAAGVRAYKAKDPVLVIKTILTEIEGVMADAHHRRTGQQIKGINNMLDFMTEVAEGKAAGAVSHMFPHEFADYMKSYTYAGFERGGPNVAVSRHSVGHGAAPGDQYTMPRALQSLLILDQLAFYGC